MQGKTQDQKLQSKPRSRLQTGAQGFQTMLHEHART
jgi:hypothetical protein